ncbi:ComEC/Rec2 family competence protein [Nocardioides gilvus]|uniref:ComEC/Rec2 family competence protein n=1 Tax=Nocardioides gilvus TaxID=1735589 RepID=UPI000D74F642|nr:ComEC/Rec2 family competence protein [Nocardioides gilvus]
MERSTRAAVDLRLPLLGVAAWLGALWGIQRPGDLLLTLSGMCVVGAGLGLLQRARRGLHDLVTATAVLLVFGTAFAGAAFRTADTAAGVVVELAAQQERVKIVGIVVSDPRTVQGTFADSVVVRIRVDEISWRERTWRVRTRVVAIAGTSWGEVRLGSRVAGRGTLTPDAEGAGALLKARGDPEVQATPDVWWRVAEVVRAGIRDAVATRTQDQRVLVPSLVVGDDDGLDRGLAEDFRTTGLTHLLAVSGTNLTLMLGCLVALARWSGVRGRGRYVVAAAAIAGFVLLARGEPSVVRAATMGAIGALAMARNGRGRGVRCLGGAVVVLLCWQPALAVTAGFALSVLATAGILLLAPTWSEALARWMPRWAADAVAVPAAAQMACTPVVAALSGEVSLVAVLANMLVAPAVAPVTVLGLLGGCLAVIWVPLGQWVALPGAWAVQWIITVAQWGAGLATPAVEWGTTPAALTALVVLSGLLALVAPTVLARPLITVPLVSVVLVVVLMRPPAPGWPPDGWVMAACDVGQGDALVLRAAEAQAVVVDAGPDPRAVDRCLARLGIDAVPLLVLTHFHADHVDGLEGVLAGRRVGTVLVSPLDDPPDRAREVDRVLAQHGVEPTVGHHLVDRVVGDVALRQVWPLGDSNSDGDGDSDRGRGRGAGESANDASLVLQAEVRGVRILLTGDIEPPAQRQLARLIDHVRVDVLKVPHHGSRHQDLRFLAALEPKVAVVSAGADNTYGHPAPSLLDHFADEAVAVLRTDRDSDVVVVQRDGSISTTTLG